LPLGNLGPRCRRRGSTGIESEEGCHELHAGSSVHERVVKLRNDAQTIAFEPFDHVHLPKRKATVELSSRQI